MNTKITRVFARTDGQGNLVKIGGLEDWAADFNKTHRLIPAKKVTR